MDDLAVVDVVDDDGSSAEECAIAAEMALVNLAALLATQPGGGLPASRLQDLKLALERTLALITPPSPDGAAASARPGGGLASRFRQQSADASNSRLTRRRAGSFSTARSHRQESGGAGACLSARRPSLTLTAPTLTARQAPPGSTYAVEQPAAPPQAPTGPLGSLPRAAAAPAAAELDADDLPAPGGTSRLASRFRQDTTAASNNRLQRRRAASCGSIRFGQRRGGLDTEEATCAAAAAAAAGGGAGGTGLCHAADIQARMASAAVSLVANRAPPPAQSAPAPGPAAVAVRGGRAAVAGGPARAPPVTVPRPPPPDAAGGGGSARARMGLAAARNNRLMQRRPSLTPQDVEEGPASMANLGRRMSLSSEAKLQGSLG